MLPGISPLSVGAIAAASAAAGTSRSAVDDSSNNVNDDATQQQHAVPVLSAGSLPMTDTDAARWSGSLAHFNEAFASKQLAPDVIAALLDGGGGAAATTATQQQQHHAGALQLLGAFNAALLPPPRPMSEVIAHKKQWLAHRQRLGINEPSRRNELIKAVRGSRVTVVAGEALTGKSTQIPVLLSDIEVGKRRRLIIVRPSAFAAAELAARLRAEFNDDASTNTTTTAAAPHVECVLPSRDRPCHPGAAVVVTVPEVLLRSLAAPDASPLLGGGVGAVIIDEAQERTAAGDLLLFHLKHMLTHSATAAAATATAQPGAAASSAAAATAGKAELWKLVVVLRATSQNDTQQAGMLCSYLSSSAVSATSFFVPRGSGGSASGGVAAPATKDAAAAAVSAAPPVQTAVAYLESAAAWGLLSASKNSNSKPAAASSTLQARLEDASKQGQTSLPVRTLLGNISRGSAVDAVTNQHRNFALTAAAYAFGDEDGSSGGAASAAAAAAASKRNNNNNNNDDEEERTPGFANSWAPLLVDVIRAAAASSLSTADDGNSDTLVAVHLPSALHSRALASIFLRRRPQQQQQRLCVAICDADSEHVDYVDDDEDSSSSSSSSPIDGVPLVLLLSGAETVFPHSLLSQRGHIVFVDTCRSLFLRTEVVVSAAAVAVPGAATAPPQLVSRAIYAFSSPEALAQRAALFAPPRNSSNGNGAAPTNCALFVQLVSGTAAGSASGGSEALRASAQQLGLAVGISVEAFGDGLASSGASGGGAAASGPRGVPRAVNASTAQQRVQQALARSQLLLYAAVNRCSAAQLTQLALLHSVLVVYGVHRAALIQALSGATPVLAAIPPPSQVPQETQLMQRQVSTWLGRLVACLPPIFVGGGGAAAAPAASAAAAAAVSATAAPAQGFCSDALAWAIPSRLIASGCVSTAAAQRQQQQQQVGASSAALVAAAAAAAPHAITAVGATDITPLGLIAGMSPFPLAVTRLLLYGTLANARSTALLLASLLLLSSSSGSVFRAGLASGLAIKRFFAANFPTSDVEAELRALKLYFSCCQQEQQQRQQQEGSGDADAVNPRVAFLREGVVSERAIHALQRAHGNLSALLRATWWRSLDNNSSGSGTPALSSASLSDAVLSIDGTGSGAGASVDQEIARHSLVRYLLTAAAYPDLIAASASSFASSSPSSSSKSAKGGVLVLSSKAASASLCANVQRSSGSGTAGGQIFVGAIGGFAVSAQQQQVGDALLPLLHVPVVPSAPFVSSALAVLTTSTGVPCKGMTAVSSAAVATERSFRDRLAHHSSGGGGGATAAVVVDASACRGWWGAVTTSWRTTSRAAASGVVGASAPQVRVDAVPGMLFDPLQQPASFFAAAAAASFSTDGDDGANSAAAVAARLSGVGALSSLTDIAIGTIARLNNGIAGATAVFLEEAAEAPSSSAVAADSAPSSKKHSKHQQQQRHEKETPQLTQRLGEVLRWAAAREATAATYLRERRRLVGRSGAAVHARTRLLPLKPFTLQPLHQQHGGGGGAGAATSALDIRTEKTTTEQCLAAVNRENARLQALIGSAASHQQHHKEAEAAAASTSQQQHHRSGGGGKLKSFYGREPTDASTVQLIKNAARLVAGSGSRVHEVVLLDTAGSEVFAFLDPKHEFHGFYLYRLKREVEHSRGGNNSGSAVHVFGDDVAELKGFLQALETAIKSDSTAMPPLPRPYTQREADEALAKHRSKTRGAALPADRGAAPDDAQQQQQQQDSLLPLPPTSSSSAPGGLVVVPPAAAPGANNNKKVMTRVIVVQAQDDGDDAAYLQQQQPLPPQAEQMGSLLPLPPLQSSGALLPTPDGAAPAGATAAPNSMLPAPHRRPHATGDSMLQYPTHPVFFEQGIMQGFSDPNLINTLEARGAFRHVFDPNYSPLYALPPPIYFDASLHYRPFSVIVSPLPEPPKALRDPLPMVLANSLGEFLGVKVGPTTIVGDVARIEVPNAAVQNRALALKTFFCLGKRLAIEENDRIFDNRVMAERYHNKRAYIQQKLQQNDRQHLAKVGFESGEGYIAAGRPLSALRGGFRGGGGGGMFGGGRGGGGGYHVPVPQGGDGGGGGAPAAAQDGTGDAMF